MVLRTALRVMVTAVGTFLVGIAGALVGIWRIDLTMGFVLRTVLALALLFAMAWTFRMRDRGATDRGSRSSAQVLVAAALAYTLNPSSWGGHVLVGQMIFPAGVLSSLVDFALWMAVALLGVRLGDRSPVKMATLPTPYA